MKLGEYIKAYRDERGMSMRDFAASTGLSLGYLSMLENDKNPKTGAPITPSIKTFNAVAAATNTTLNELLSLVDGNVSLDDVFIPNVIQMPVMRKIPLVGSIACGTPILAEENLDGDVEAPDHVRADFALRCKGDSMINARIFDGDVVYIRQQESVEHGEIAAVLIGDEATLKRVYMYDDCISLEAENPQYKPMVYRGEEMNNIRILGKAVAFTSVIR